MSGIDLLITGLCSFVPRPSLEELEGDAPLGEMIVLLAESYIPVPGRSGHMHEGHEPHIPILVCPEKYVVVPDEGYRGPDMTFQPTPYPNNQDYPGTMAVFFLDDQQITIQPDTPTKLTADLTEVKDCPGSYESFHWVAPLAELNPGSEAVRESCFEPEGDSSVVARLQLLHGRITTAKLATNLKRQVLLYRFQENDTVGTEDPGELASKGGRAIAAVVGVHFDLEDKDKQGIQFTTSLLHKHPTNRRVAAIFDRASGSSLRIRLEPTDDYRKVWIKNMPWLDILQIRELREVKCDIHFAHIYKLSKNLAGVKTKVPCITGEVCMAAAPDFRHGGGTDCPAPKMKGPPVLDQSERVGRSQSR